MRDVCTLWRLHWEPPATVVKRPPSKPPRHRFDDPLSKYAVSYGNLEEVGAFLEVYGETQRINDAQRARWRSTLESRRELLMIDLDNAKTQKAFKLDARISTSRQYAVTQRWSRAFHEWYPDADCIRYRSRQENDTLNVCLFLDRCGGDLQISSPEQLENLDPRDLLSLVLPYRISLDW